MQIFKRISMRRVQSFLLTLLILVLFALPGGTQTPVVTELWTFDLPEDLKARVYAALPVFDNLPFILASSNHSVFQIFELAAGKVNAVSVSEKYRKLGETLILPFPAITSNLPRTPMGFLVHQHDVIRDLRIVNIAGTEVAKLTDGRHFLFRLSPDGHSFVGLDSVGEHRGFSSSTVIYRFFSRIGKQIGEVESRPASGVDSIYTADAGAFLINSRKDGLSSYDPCSVARLWNIPGEFRFFASSDGLLGRVILSKVGRKNEAEFYQNGQFLWTVNLHDFGINEDIRKLAISPNGETIGIASSKDVLIISSTNAAQFGRAGDAALLGRFQVGQTFNINSIEVNDREVAAVGAQSRTKQSSSGIGKVFVLKADGTVLYHKDTKHERTNAFIPTVRFDPSGRILLIETLESFTLVSLS
jgi:hypothetical protein